MLQTNYFLEAANGIHASNATLIVDAVSRRRRSGGTMMGSCTLSTSNNTMCVTVNKWRSPFKFKCWAGWIKRVFCCCWHDWSLKSGSTGKGQRWDGFGLPAICLSVQTTTHEATARFKWTKTKTSRFKLHTTHRHHTASCKSAPLEKTTDITDNWQTKNNQAANNYWQLKTVNK